MSACYRFPSWPLRLREDASGSFIVLAADGASVLDITTSRLDDREAHVLREFVVEWNRANDPERGQ